MQEYRCPACKPMMKATQEYWIVSDYDEVFLSEDAAIEWDFDRNPEYHGCKEWSMARGEEGIFSVPFEDLTPEQKDNLAYKLFCY